MSNQKSLTERTVDSLSPASGMQGTQVTIAGSRMLGGGASIASVTFGSIATSIVGNNDNDNEVVVQVLASGTANEQSNVVVVANTGAIITLVNGYTSIAAASIVQLVPASGQAGTEVDIQGTGLLGGGSSITSVTLAGADVLTIDSGTSDTTISVTVGASSSSGPGDVVLVANTGATSTLIEGWEYVAPGAVTSIVPPQGQLGTRVDIIGTNLHGGGSSTISVTLAGVEVQTIIVDDNEQVGIIAADGTPGAGYIILTADTGAVISTGCA